MAAVALARDHRPVDYVAGSCHVDHGAVRAYAELWEEFVINERPWPAETVQLLDDGHGLVAVLCGECVCCHSSLSRRVYR